jgi:hypothetical protein
MFLFKTKTLIIQNDIQQVLCWWSLRRNICETSQCLLLFRDTVETGLSALVFGFGKVTNELSYQGKKVQTSEVSDFIF